MEKRKKYKHFFDYYDIDGKWVGGCEPETDSVDKPAIQHIGYSNTWKTIYLGWCYFDDYYDMPLIACGHCCPDNVMRDKETKHLSPIMETVMVLDGQPITRMIDSKYGKSTYETACEFIGINPCAEYIQYKQKKEQHFINEWNKVKNDKEYFRTEYFKFNEKNNR